MSEQRILSLKNEGIEVCFDLMQISDPRQAEIDAGLASVNDRLAKNQQKIDEINTEINRLTSHADHFDYLLAAISGTLAGMIDSVWVGELSMSRGATWGSDAVNRFVVNVARANGYKGDTIVEAIPYLERYHLASDSVTSSFGGGLQHHLRDFAHHPTPTGLMFSVLTQFTGNAYGTDTSGALQIVPIQNRAFIGNDFPQKILYGFIYWIFHMVSDMAGSKATPGAGTGLPGPLLSLLKELSVLPFFRNVKINDIEFSAWLSKLFNGTQLAERDWMGRITKKVQFDLRAELGVAYELGRQALPVLINECLVRGFYFIRRLSTEIKRKHIRNIKQLNGIDWDAVLPFKNRTIVRMLTIAHGTFTAVDLADAAIRSAAGGFTPTNFVLRINFVGVGRFVVACGTDVAMGVKRNQLESEKIDICMEQLYLYNAKVAYTQAEMWISAREARYALDKLKETLAVSIRTSAEHRKAISDSIDDIEVEQLCSANREFIEQLLNQPFD